MSNLDTVISLDEIVKVAEDRAKAGVEDMRLEMIPPTFVFDLPSGKIGYAIAGYESDEDKVLVIEGMKQLFRDMGVVRYVYLAEAWAANYDENDEMVEENGKVVAPRVFPKDHPKRIEIVSIIGVEYGRVIARHARITNLPGGQRLLGEFRSMEGQGTPAGRFLELLPERQLN